MQLKILIEMKHGLGDCVCDLPMVCALRQQFPDACLAILVRGEAQETIFRHSEAAVDRFYHWGIGGWWRRICLIREIRRERFDYGFLGLVTSPWRDRALFRLFGVTRCFGETYQRRWGFPAKYRGSFIDRNLALLEPLATRAWDDIPHLLPPQGMRSLWQTENRHIAINIGGGTGGRRGDAPPKAWPYWPQLIEMLQREPSVEIALLGGASERSLVGACGACLRAGNVLDFVGRLSIEESMSLLAEADISLGVDTGMQHIAAALGTATLTLFGPTSPATCAPRGGEAQTLSHVLSCRPCIGTRAWYDCPTRACMRGISVEEVFHSCMDRLEERGRHHAVMD